EGEQQHDEQRLVRLAAGWAQQPPQRSGGRSRSASTKAHNKRYVIELWLRAAVAISSRNENCGRLGIPALNSRAAREKSPRLLPTATIGQLLWAGQGVTSPDGKRAAPSAGALYPLELYVVTPGR